MLDVLLTASVAFIITFLAIPVILQIAEKKKLYDIPDERKVHTRLIASLGGVGIFAGFMLACLLSIQAAPDSQLQRFMAFFAAAFVIFFLGFKDDLMILSATKKFIGQIIAASILIHLGDIRLYSMHGLMGFNELPEAFSLALSYLTIIVVINSFNLIDGIDGLAASLGILTMAVFGTYFFISGQQAYALLSFSMVGSLLAFMIFNHHPAKIFMGDSGSLMIGLINSILVIHFINIAEVPVTGSILPVSIQIPAAVAIGFAILIVPLLDTLRVFSIRIFNGRSPFTPDRNHVHHLLLDRGFSHASVTLICLGVNIAFIGIAWLGRSLGPNYLMMVMLALAFSGLGILYYGNSRRRRSLVVSREANGQAKLKSASSPKLVTVQKETSAAENN